MPQQTPFEKTVELIDAANREDPNMESSGGESVPKELLYGERMSEMIGRFMPDADEVGRIAVRAQHIERWKSPRDAFPMNREGYFRWRTQLYKFHADTVAGLMAEAGYDEASIERVRKAVGKKAVKINRDTQLLEDVAALVFIEHYMQAFADKHPEYSEEKWIDIILKTWKKMSKSGQQFALSGSLKLPEPLVPLIQKALA
ncbi:MAG: DUF4202 domain-containing protein [Candidatus Sedimenticola sp. (ex Thyasira tokunagai)]